MAGAGMVRAFSGKAAIRPLVFFPPSTSDIEASRIQAVHQNGIKVRAPRSRNYIDSGVTAGTQISGVANAQGGTFNPQGDGSNAV